MAFTILPVCSKVLSPLSSWSATLGCSRAELNAPRPSDEPRAEASCPDCMWIVLPLPYRRYHTTAPHPTKNSPSNIPRGCPAAAAKRKHIPPIARNRPIYSLTGIKESPFDTKCSPFCPRVIQHVDSINMLFPLNFVHVIPMQSTKNCACRNVREFVITLIFHPHRYY